MLIILKEAYSMIAKFLLSFLGELNWTLCVWVVTLDWVKPRQGLETYFMQEKSTFSLDFYATRNFCFIKCWAVFL